MMKQQRGMSLARKVCMMALEGKLQVAVRGSTMTLIVSKSVVFFINVQVGLEGYSARQSITMSKLQELLEKGSV